MDKQFKNTRKCYINNNRKYFKVYITDNVDGIGANESLQEVARFTSKGLMFACLDSIREIYENTDYTVVYDHIV